ncbi:MAG: glutamate--tRNA ligase family protein [Planctomycetota bacterium]
MQVLSGTPDAPGVTRLAPSPTGALHLGNALSFLLTWALARRLGWSVVLRIEDLETPRTKAWAAQQAIDDLRWLGLDWDEGPLTQAGDLEPYRAAMDRLAWAGLVYPCTLSRREIEAAASAPNEGDHELRFGPELRPAERPPRFDDAGTNWRLAVDPGAVPFRDALLDAHGPVARDPSLSVGDFVVWTKGGQPSYQLAATVDDARQGVDRIVRGDDLLDSGARQALLRGHLGLSPEPIHLHHPLVRGADGRRLAKRHGDTRLASLRDLGVPAERVVGLVAWWLGATPRRGELAARHLPERLGPDSIGSLNGIRANADGGGVTFGEEDLTWLIDPSAGA